LKIARVFTRRTSMTPDDPDAYVGLPNMFMPQYDEVHVSVTFTWDIAQGEQLARQWKPYCGRVKIGGPALGDPGNEFMPGVYVKKGVVITSRGCPNRCGFCFVPKREGKIRELFVHTGNNILDNNILACSSDHIRKVFAMLKTQHEVTFSGGLEAERITDKILYSLKLLRIKELFTACDSHNKLSLVCDKVKKIRRSGFTRHNTRCYVLIGNDMDKEKEMLTKLYIAGAYPFAQLYQPEEKKKYNQTWKNFNRLWSRPALMKTYMRKNYGSI